jgi:hypothetical protein
MALRHVVSTLTLEQATTIATRAIATGRARRCSRWPSSWWTEAARS